MLLVAGHIYLGMPARATHCQTTWPQTRFAPTPPCREDRRGVSGHNESGLRTALCVLHEYGHVVTSVVVALQGEAACALNGSQRRATRSAAPRIITLRLHILTKERVRDLPGCFPG